MNYQNFKKLENSQLGKASAISSFGNLQVIKGLSFFCPHSKKDSPILEVGGGIGTITKVLLENFENDIYCYETNDFCLKKLNVLKRKSNIVGRLEVISDLSNYLQDEFYAIVIDGPIKKKELDNIIKNSKELRFIVVENYRLLQRLLVSIALFKSMYRQQYVEIRHNFKPSSTIFFIENANLKNVNFHIVYDFLFSFFKILPKLVLHSFLSKGKILGVGRSKSSGYL